MTRKDRAPKSSAFLIPLLGVVLLSVCAGCLQVEQTLVLHPDGSGVVHLAYAISEERAEQMQLLAETMYAAEGGEDTEALSLDFNDDDIRRDFKEFEPYGIQLQSVKTDSRDGWKYRTIVFTFKDLAGLEKTGFLSDRDVSLVRTAEGHYLFTQSGNGETGPGDDVEAWEDYVEDPFARKLMDGFRAVIHVRTPTRILKSNAHRRTENTATWAFDREEDPDALHNVQTVTMQVMFEGKGLSIPVYRSRGSKGR